MISPFDGMPRTKSTPQRADSARRDEEKTFGAVTFGLLALAACGMACLVSLLPAAGHDQMWLLYGARLALHGAKMYGPEIFETNPPMIFWLSAVPVAVAHWLHVAETAMGKLFVVALECLVGWVCVRLLRTMRQGELDRGTLNGLIFLFVTVFAVMPARDFGQRDHLLALLCLPYVFAAAVTAEGRAVARWAGVMIGVAALVGIAMKPHQVLIPIAVETTLILLRYRGKFEGPGCDGGRGAASRWCGRRLWRWSGLRAWLLVLAVQIFTPRIILRGLCRWCGTRIGRLGSGVFGHLVTEAVQLHVLAAIALGVFFAEGWRRASALT